MDILLDMEAVAGNALASYDKIDRLLAEYRADLSRIGEIAAFASGDSGGAIRYFLAGNCESGSGVPSADRLFRREGAVAALDAAYWSRAVDLTDVLEMMPQARRAQWEEQIRLQKCPPFDDTTVRNTLTDLLASRAKFFAERVDGIFRGLSGEHVTNSPAAFGRRMIISCVLHDYGCQNTSKCGLISDLRCVVARLMRRDEPRYHATSRLIDVLKGRWGEWVPVDGGALRIRLYKKGTAHLEVHPDIAWRLNSVLAHLYPHAIPAEHREKPRRSPKSLVLIQRPLPFAVVDLLAQLEPARFYEDTGDAWRPKRQVRVPNAVEFPYRCREAGKAVMAEAEAVLESLGGIRTEHGWQFDYPPAEVIDDVVTSGCVPDGWAHQFYPTPPSVAEPLLELARIGPEHRCLEPSAGLGALVSRMPRDRTTCVEVSPLRAKVLAARGFAVECADFLLWSAEKLGTRYDRILMNPPFDQGRWRAHLEAAAGMLAPGGRLVAVLPVGAKRAADLLPGFVLEFGRTFDRAFPGVSQDVVLLAVDRPA